MSNEPYTTTRFEQAEARRAQLLRITLSVGGAAVGIVMALFVALGWLVPNFPTSYLVPILAVLLASLLVAFWLLRQGRVSRAVDITLLAIASAVFAVIPTLNGVTGPVAPAITVLPLLTALLSGRKETVRITIAAGMLYLAMFILEEIGVLQPWQVFGIALPIVQHVLLIFVLVIGAFLIAYSTGLTQEALVTAEQRGQELVTASLEAEQAALAEREAREREERIAGQLRQAVREYSVFLERVTAGDHSARLNLETGDSEQTVGELLTLGWQLNATVDTLVAALNELQAVQRRYVQQVWEGAPALEAGHRGFRLREEAVEPADEAWLEPMTEAVREQSTAVTGHELALPITLRGQIIGAMGARRAEGVGWSEEDLTLVEAIADQLAQTMEGLRLLDETQRSAARDRMISEATAHMRETLDVEAVLRTTANEMYQALGLDEVIVRLVADQAGSDLAP